MDPLTQGALGAAAAQVGLQSRVPASVAPRLWWLGALGGMAADLDILIRAPGDPMVALTFHRHFTHSLAFVPLGGLLVALPFALRAKKSDRPWILAATTLGYATHALLDAFTSYGTLLWWPFADTRVAWNVISIIDPIYTGLLICGVWLAKRRLSARPAIVAMLLSSLYMAFCGLQRSAVREAQARILADAGTRAERRFVFPQFLANTRWRALALSGDTLRADAIAKPWFGPAVYIPGQTHPRFDPKDAPEAMLQGPGGERIRSALETINWFGGDRMYLEAEGPGWWRVCDARYSRLAEGFEGVFCWRLEPGNATTPVQQLRMSPREGDQNRLGRILPFGELRDYRSLPE